MLIVLLTGCIFFAALIFYFIRESQIQDNLAPPIENAFVFPKQESVNFGLPALPVGRPIRLKIPNINVDSAIEYVGVASNGEMDVPKVPADVAWFSPGTRPGENGSAVIAGHYDWKDGQPAVFADLSKLRPGDKLYIEDDKGAIITFVMRESRNYDPAADATGVFSSSDGRAHLNLVTCKGVWNKTSKSYSQRLVVFADKE